MNSLSIFLSYNLSSTDMVVIWRLQTLAAAHGITMYVPHPEDRRGDHISSSTAQMIDASTLVIAVWTKQPSSKVLQEIQYALSKSKPVLLVVEQGIKPPHWLKEVPALTFDLQRPGDFERRLIDYLNSNQMRHQLKLNKKEARAVGALLGIGLALLALWLLTKEK